MARRPRFEGRRGRPESPFGHMRQSNWPGCFQTINGGLRRLAQADGWSRGYKDNSQTIIPDKTHTTKSFT